MAINIAAPGANAEALRAALLGAIKISSGVMAGAEVDIALPSGYDLFTLKVFGLLVSDFRAISLLTSSDGGSTFHSDAGDYQVARGVFGAEDTAWFVEGLVAGETEGSFVPDSMTADMGSMASADIFPGSATSYCSITVDSLTPWQTGTNFPAKGFSVVTVTAEKARQNALRLFPGGGETFSAGQYILYGHKV